MRRGRGILVALAIALLAFGPQPVAAETCADAEVRARGEPARLRTLARIKAIGNWRSKVRMMTDLGPAYDDWRKAAQQVERCVDNESTVVCTVSAKPCRR